MKKSHVSVPEPSSKFLKVECGECNETQTVYSHATTVVTCNSCGNKIASPSGSLAIIHGSVKDSSNKESSNKDSSNKA